MSNRQHIEKLLEMTPEERHAYLEALDMRTFDSLVNYMYSGESGLRIKTRKIFRGIYNDPDGKKPRKKKKSSSVKSSLYDPVRSIPRRYK